jgi:hypothetical protein
VFPAVRQATRPPMRASNSVQRSQLDQVRQVAR